MSGPVCRTNQQGSRGVQHTEPNHPRVRGWLVRKLSQAVEGSKAARHREWLYAIPSLTSWVHPFPTGYKENRTRKVMFHRAARRAQSYWRTSTHRAY